jgi:hypothetical protein
MWSSKRHTREFWPSNRLKIENVGKVSHIVRQSRR